MRTKRFLGEQTAYWALSAASTVSILAFTFFYFSWMLLLTLYFGTRRVDSVAMVLVLLSLRTWVRFPAPEAAFLMEAKSENA